MPETVSGLAQFDELVAEVMAEWRIPGLAMAVVRKDEPPLLRCWGMRDIDNGAPVTSDTVFPICSITKSFTATALALLVDQGRIDWDAPVRAVLPEFQLRDPIATEQASLRDLLTHRTGLRCTTGCIRAAISTMRACSRHSATSNRASRSAARGSTII
jgi:CubicO group peptidase (beta-lactamase class C family)